MENKLIQTLALLKMNWESPQRKDYLDIFIPFIIECIKDSAVDPITPQSIQPILRRKFAISFPENIIYSLLKRAKKKKILTLSDKAMFRNVKAISEFKTTDLFKKKQEKLLSRYEIFIKELIKFAYMKYHKVWKTKYAEKILFDYLDTNGLTILSTLTSGVPLKQVIGKKRRSNKDIYVIAKFILNAEHEKTADFNYFESIVQGHILASSMYLPDISTANKTLKNTKFYFDTSFLIYSLGYAGPERQVACKELLDLLSQSGACLYCFEHTVIEIEGILYACSCALDPTKSGALFGQAAEYFLANHFTETDVMQLKNSLRDDIYTNLNVAVVDKPEYCKYSIDETYLRQELDRHLKYANPRALDFDVDSISAIIRLRKGQIQEKIEDCKAVFITTNYALARAVRFYSETNGHDRSTVPPCITDHRLTAHVWLKMPNKAPSLPKKRIIADCYAAIQPSDKFWQRYFDQIEKLKTKKNISEEQYLLLRYDIGVRKRIAELSQGDEELFEDDVWKAGTITELINLSKNEIKKQLHKVYDAEFIAKEEKIEKITNAYNELKKEMDDQQRREELRKVARKQKVRKISKRISNFIGNIIKYGFILILLFAAVISLFFSNSTIGGVVPVFFVGIALFVFFILTILNLAWGVTVEKICRRITFKIDNKLEKMIEYFIL